jgi:hypothetical protein
MASSRDLRCQAKALRYAARRSRKRSIVAALIARAHRLEAEAALIERNADNIVTAYEVTGRGQVLA